MWRGGGITAPEVKEIQQLVGKKEIDPLLKKDFGIEPEEFDEKGLLEFLEEDKYGEEKLTEGIFAPWAIYKDDFQSIGGHDPLYAPQSKEDSDILSLIHISEPTRPY